jgi:hypothetical protein
MLCVFLIVIHSSQQRSPWAVHHRHEQMTVCNPDGWQKRWIENSFAG